MSCTVYTTHVLLSSITSTFNALLVETNWECGKFSYTKASKTFGKNAEPTIYVEKEKKEAGSR